MIIYNGRITHWHYSIKLISELTQYKLLRTRDKRWIGMNVL